MNVRSPRTMGRRRSPFMAILGYTLRSCFPRKRWMAVLVPCAGALLFGLLSYAISDNAERAFARVGRRRHLRARGPDRRARHRRLGARGRGAIRHVPLHLALADPAWQIVVGRWLAGSFVALVTIAPAAAIAALIAGSPESAGPAFLAAAVGGAAYVAVFIAIASLTRRTAVWSLAFVFLVERLLGQALTGIAQLSPTWESRAIFLGELKDVPSSVVREGIPQGGAAIVRLTIVTIVVLAIAVWRIGHMRWAGASD